MGSSAKNRTGVVLAFKPENATFNIGSINFSSTLRLINIKMKTTSFPRKRAT